MIPSPKLIDSKTEFRFFLMERKGSSEGGIELSRSLAFLCASNKHWMLFRSSCIELPDVDWSREIITCDISPSVVPGLPTKVSQDIGPFPPASVYCRCLLSTVVKSFSQLSEKDVDILLYKHIT
jgi:hypothetical protein